MSWTPPETVDFHAHGPALTLTDAWNRAAAATGSVGYATAAGGAGYNGHHVTVEYNDYRKYYVTEYTWGERVVLMRGTATQCIDAALRELNRGPRGGSVRVSLRPDDASEADSFPQLKPGPFTQPDWHDWKHAEIHHALHWQKTFGGNVLAKLQAADTPEAYRAARMRREP
jgi:hypothetical protein